MMKRQMYGRANFDLLRRGFYARREIVQLLPTRF